MLYPKFLEKNNTICIPAPSDGSYDNLKKAKYKNAKQFLEGAGYKVILSENIFDSHKARSADNHARAREINEMFKQKECNALLCAAGGEFLMEILPYINFNLIKKNPKFIGGFSDPTGLLYPITTKLDIATLYGSNFGSFGSVPIHQSQKDFFDLLEGKKLTFKSYEKYEEESLKKVTGLEPLNLTHQVKWKTLDNKDTKFSGRIIGGCFDILSMLAGTKYDGFKNFSKKYAKDGIIWYFDNCELSMEEVIRVLWKFNELGYFANAKGIVFGRFGVNLTNVGYDVKTCLEDSVISKLNIPVIYDADFSHKSPCMPVLNGSIAEIEVKNHHGFVKYMLK